MKLRKSEVDSSIFNEIQLILAEKRTALSTLRSGIAVFALPLSVLSVLIATSRLYNILHVMSLLVPLLLLNFGLVVLGTFLVTNSLLRLRRLDRLIETIKKEHSAIAEFLT
nr:hypothetical protein [Pedosphaera parvula]